MVILPKYVKIIIHLVILNLGYHIKTFFNFCTL